MKTILLFIVSLGVCFFFLNKNDDEIRIRVISNSNSESDLKYKDEVVSYLKEEVLNDIQLTDHYLENNYKTIEQILNKEFDDISVSYEYHTFKNKTYNDIALENKEFKTLLIYIGHGEGSNWWGSIFDNSLQYESTDEVIYKWYFKKD